MRLQGRARLAALQMEVNRLEQQSGEPLTTVPEPPSTALSIRPDEAAAGQARGLYQAIQAAPRGDVPAVSAGLGVACGYLPPGPASAEEIARGLEWRAAMEKQAADAKARAAYGIGPDGSGKVHDLDHNGQPIGYRQPHPQDVYRFPTGTGSYGSGFRTGW